MSRTGREMGEEENRKERRYELFSLQQFTFVQMRREKEAQRS